MPLKYLIFIAMCFLIVEATAQVEISRVDSARHAVDSLLRSNVAKTDTATRPSIRGLDTIAAERIDTLRLKFNQTISGGQHKDRQYRDSIQRVTEFVNQKVSGPSHFVAEKLDTVGAIVAVPAIYTDKINEAQSGIIKSEGSAVTGKLREIRANRNNIQDKTSGEIKEKVRQLSVESGGQGNLPGTVNLPGENLPGVNGAMPDLGIDQKIPAIPSLETDLPKVPDLRTPATNLDLPATPNVAMPDANISGLNMPNVSSDISQYSSAVKKIVDGEVPDTEMLESKAVSEISGTKEIGELQANQQIVQDQEARLESYKDKDAYKKKVLERSKKMVALHAMAYDKELQEVITKVARYQKQAGVIASMKKKDLPQKRDAWKRLKRYERFVPGLTLQIQKPGGWLVDVNPTVRYRLTTYWSIGLGWNERIHAGAGMQSQYRERIYGPRSYSELILLKGFSFRLDIESMNVLKQELSLNDIQKRIWIWSYMAGVKKDFSFVSRVNGNVQFMYNLIVKDNAPYPTRFNVRFGFEFINKKRSKKSNSEK